MQTLRNKTYSLLRQSEGFFKTDMVYLAKGGFWITFGQIISSLLSLTLVLAFANFLPKETYGLYRYILSLVGVLGVFSLTGMNSAVARSVAEGNEGALRSSVNYQIKWNLLMLLAFLTTSCYYFLHSNTMLGTSFLILGFCVPATLAFNTYGSFLEGKREFRLASVSTIISSLIYVLGMLLSIALSGEVVWLIVTYALTTLSSTLFFYIYTLKKFKPTNDTASDTLKYGRELTFIGFIAPVASQIDKIMIAHFWGPAQLAIYSLAQVAPERITSLIKDWVGIGLPKFTNKTPEEINTVFYKRLVQGIGIGAIASSSYILLAPYLFSYLLPQYIESVRYSQILALSFLFAIPNRYISLLFISQRLSRPILLNNVIQNTVKIGIYVIFGLFGGIMGLIVANVLYSLTGLCINIAVWRISTRT